MSLDTTLLSILACPEDKGALHYLTDEEILYNPRLHRAYSVVDGIPVMLIEEARQVSDAEHSRLMARIESESIKPTFGG